MYKKLEAQCSEFGRFLQKRTKGQYLRFHIQPNKPTPAPNMEQPSKSIHTQSNPLWQQQTDKNATVTQKQAIIMASAIAGVMFVKYFLLGVLYPKIFKQKEVVIEE